MKQAKLQLKLVECKNKLDALDLTSKNLEKQIEKISDILMDICISLDDEKVTE